MKRTVLLLFSIILFVKAFSQIKLETKYPANNAHFFTVKLEEVGVKYGLMQLNSSSPSLSWTFTLYNENHSIYKTFSTPSYPIPNQIGYYVGFLNFSNTLFNTNPADVEYIMTYALVDTISGKARSTSYVEVLSENKSSLFKIDSAVMGAPLPPPYSVYNLDHTIFGIVKFENSCKLIVKSKKKSDKAIDDPYYPQLAPLVYSLPGCTPVITSTRETKNQDTHKASLSSPVPNPSSDFTVIHFELPKDELYGEIVVYNTIGRRVKSYTIDSAYGNLILNNSDLETGSYYYTLSAGAKKVKGHTMLIIK